MFKFYLVFLRCDDFFGSFLHVGYVIHGATPSKFVQYDHIEHMKFSSVGLNIFKMYLKFSGYLTNMNFLK